MNRIYDFEPSDYGEMVLVRGVGARTVRALALISELIFGDAPSWQDPVKYSYCLGGKDGVPYPVDREPYDESVEILDNAIRDAKVDDRERIGALRRLRRCIPEPLRRTSPPWNGQKEPSRGLVAQSPPDPLRYHIKAGSGSVPKNGESALG